MTGRYIPPWSDEADVATALVKLGNLVALNEGEAATAFIELAEAVCARRTRSSGNVAFVVYDQFMVAWTAEGWRGYSVGDR